MWRRRAHRVSRKKACVFTSEAPARDPMRRVSSLMRSLRMSDLQRLGNDVSVGVEQKGGSSYCDTCGAPCSGNGTSSRKMFANV